MSNIKGLGDIGKNPPGGNPGSGRGGPPNPPGGGGFPGGFDFSSLLSGLGGGNKKTNSHGGNVKTIHTESGLSEELKKSWWKSGGC